MHSVMVVGRTGTIGIWGGFGHEEDWDLQQTHQFLRDKDSLGDVNYQCMLFSKVFFFRRVGSGGGGGGRGDMILTVLMPLFH